MDYNQNAWGRTLASVYPVRPQPQAPVSAPVTWLEVQTGFDIQDFHMGNVPERVAQQGDLWEPLLRPTGRGPFYRRPFPSRHQAAALAPR